MGRDGAKSLRRLASRMERSDHAKPSALAVIVPQGYGAAGTGEVLKGRQDVSRISFSERPGMSNPYSSSAFEGG